MYRFFINTEFGSYELELPASDPMDAAVRIQQHVAELELEGVSAFAL